MNVLELFAGSRSIGKVAKDLGMNVFSVDWKNYENINNNNMYNHYYQHN